ncbi:MAG: serine--tRNA ligase [Longimicrobiales bacterium]
MLDLKRIRENPGGIVERLRRRGNADYAGMIDGLLRLDEDRRGAIAEVDRLRARRNEVSPQVGRLKQAGRHEEAEPLIREMREAGDRMAEQEQRRADLETAVRDALLAIPNLPEPVVPAGGEDANVVVREGGERAAPPATLPHWEIADHLGLLDLPRGAKVAGSGFPHFTGWGARLERALINFMVDLHSREHGYTEISPPFVINEQAALGTGHLPKYHDDMYFIAEDRLYLVPTAEVPVTNLHADELMSADALPIRYVAYTPCFRREAGSHGKDTRGLLRLHQFDKVEMMRFERPENSAAALDELTGHAERVLQLLGLQYRVLLLAGGDLGFANAQTYDLEVWSPGVERWLEVSSCSLYNDYQARRANVRYRPEPNAKPEFVHTLNGSGLGVARALAALLETYQQSDGSVRVPQALQDYVGTDVITA